MLTLWCLMQSPLIMGGELPDLDDWTTILLTNRNLLAMDDQIREKRQIYHGDDSIVWQAESATLSYFAIFNISNQPHDVTADLLAKLSGPKQVEDVWNHRPILVQNVPTIGAHDVLDVMPIILSGG